MASNPLPANPFPRSSSIPPAAKQALGWGGGGISVAGLIVWAVLSVQSESEAVRSRLDKMVEAQQAMVISQTKLATQLEAASTAAEKEAKLAKEARDELKARVRRLEERARRRR